MTVPRYSYFPTLFRSVALLGIFLTCFVGLGAETFAVSPLSEKAPPLGTNKSEGPHLSLPSGIVGLALPNPLKSVHIFKLGFGLLLSEVRRQNNELRKTLHSQTNHQGFA